ncbi:hypothetical protein [Fredinandcohnia sp. 179-A 10B2 NHS]|uniref:hypothetical protein n=1 Tax=Fredinandcohnia sp. 179-A 10B2 NHS TaxID=3235176 RepID=UPI0039A0EAB5
MKKWVNYLLINLVLCFVFFLFFHFWGAYFASRSLAELALVILMLLPLGFALIIREKLNIGTRKDRIFFVLFSVVTILIVRKVYFSYFYSSGLLGLHFM